MVEDTDPDLLVDVYSWIYIANLVAAFVAPFSGLLIATYSLVPTVRFLFLLSFVMMTAKFVIMNGMVTETSRASTDGRDPQPIPVRNHARLRRVMRDILHSRAALGDCAAGHPGHLAHGARYLLVDSRDRATSIPTETLAIYQSVRSIIMLLVFFLVMPTPRCRASTSPCCSALAAWSSASSSSMSTPAGSYAVPDARHPGGGLSMPAASAMLDKLLVLVVEPKGAHASCRCSMY